MMRFLPCYQAVESMRLGATPSQAAADAMARIAARHPTFQGGIVVADAVGRHAGAANGWTFTYSLSSRAAEGVQVFTVTPPAGHSSSSPSSE